MRFEFKDIVFDPEDGEPLVFIDLDGIGSGILVNSVRKIGYPVVNGVPVLLPNSFTPEFLTRHHSKISANTDLMDCKLDVGTDIDWSFSREWDAHFRSDNDRTWGYTVQERVEQFFMETMLDSPGTKSMRLLDAGCGNGALTDKLGNYCAQVVGIDFSSGVHNAERLRKSENVCFIQGDLQKPPFAKESFDLIISIGVLHHTDNTKKSFDAVAGLVKPGGKMYVWLYRKPEGFFGRNIKVPIYDAMRWIISRLPPKAQNMSVKLYARLVYSFHRLRKGDSPIPLEEYVVSAFDDLTCRWRYYHNPVEVAGWFYDAGFSSPTLSHWDNPYGFGLVAEREAQTHTPGIHYGDGVKLWDNEQTLLGRLHDS